MKIKITAIFLLLSSFILLNANSKLKPPVNLEKTLSIIRMIEENYREKEWSNVKRDITTLKNEIVAMEKELKNAGAGNYFKSVLMNINEYSNLISKEKADENMEILLQKISNDLLHCSDYFDYPMPLIFKFMMEQSEELKEEILGEEKNGESKDELEEIKELWEIINKDYLNKIDKSLDSQKIKYVTDINKNLEDLSKVLKSKDISKIINHQKILNSNLENLSKLYK